MIRKFEIMAAAAGMAEGGDHESARQLLAELSHDLKGVRPRILVVSRNVPLERAAVSYALGLGRRMNLDLLFLDVLSKQSSRRKMAALGSRFQTILEELGVLQGQQGEHRLRHAVLAGEFKTLLNQACRVVGNISMVILQKRSLEPCVSNLPVPVFCFDMDRTAQTTRS